MERRKGRGNSNTDELAFVKAAAWAWYTHGSGSDDSRSMREYDVTRNKTTHKPSRYKLEAIRQVVHEELTNVSCSASATTPPIHLHADNSLLDTYEIERISRQLDHYIESSHAKYYGNNGHGSVKDGLKVVSSIENGSRETKKIEQRSKKSRGFWLRHAVICGSAQDVVHDGTSSASSGCPANHVPVVGVVRCRPRGAHAKRINHG